jgi:hypothetical protein
MDRMTRDILIAMAVIVGTSLGIPLIASLLAHLL